LEKDISTILQSLFNSLVSKLETGVNIAIKCCAKFFQFFFKVFSMTKKVALAIIALVAHE